MLTKSWLFVAIENQRMKRKQLTRNLGAVKPLASCFCDAAIIAYGFNCHERTAALELHHITEFQVAHWIIPGANR